MGFELPLDAIWLTGTALWGEAVARAGDRPDDAALLLDRLSPWSGQIAFTGISSYGAVDRVLALLAEQVGRVDDADRLFAAAEAQHERIGAPSLLARTRLDWGTALARRGDEQSALPLLTSAREAAERLGCAGILARADALLSRSSSSR
jgi:hypothetical protein